MSFLSGTDDRGRDIEADYFVRTRRKSGIHSVAYGLIEQVCLEDAAKPLTRQPVADQSDVDRVTVTPPQTLRLSGNPFGCVPVPQGGVR